MTQLNRKPSVEDALKAVESLAELIWKSHLQGVWLAPQALNFLERLKSIQLGCEQLRACDRNQAFALEILNRPLPEMKDSVHIVYQGRAICGFPGVPKFWPANQSFTDMQNAGLATCGVCMEAWVMIDIAALELKVKSWEESSNKEAVIHFRAKALGSDQEGALCGATSGRDNTVDTYVSCPTCKELLRGKNSPPGAAAPVGVGRLVHLRLGPGIGAVCGRHLHSDIPFMDYEEDRSLVTCAACRSYVPVKKWLPKPDQAVIHLVRGTGAAMCGKSRPWPSERKHKFVEADTIELVTCAFCLHFEENRKSAAGAAAPMEGIKPTSRRTVHLRLGHDLGFVCGMAEPGPEHQFVGIKDRSCVTCQPCLEWEITESGNVMHLKVGPGLGTVCGRHVSLDRFLFISEDSPVITCSICQHRKPVEKSRPENKIVYHLMSLGKPICGKPGEPETWGLGHAILHSWDSPDLNCPDCFKKMGAGAAAPSAPPAPQDVLHLAVLTETACGRLIIELPPSHHITAFRFDDVTCPHCISAIASRNLRGAAAKDIITHLTLESGVVACGKTPDLRKEIAHCYVRQENARLVSCPHCLRNMAAGAIMEFGTSGASDAFAAVTSLESGVITMVPLSNNRAFRRVHIGHFSNVLFGDSYDAVAKRAKELWPDRDLVYNKE